jgi:hypothetical protein
MSNLAISLWLADVCGNLQPGLMIPACILFAFASILQLVWEVAGIKAPIPRIARVGFILAPAVFGFALFLPSEATVKQMIAATYAERILTSPQIASIADPGVQLIKEYIESELKRLRGKP